VVQIGSGVVADPGREEVTCGASTRGIEIEREPENWHVPRFVVIDAELLYIEVLARVALPCDSGQSDQPN
jgi:hypothetical protein